MNQRLDYARRVYDGWLLGAVRDFIGQEKPPLKQHIDRLIQEGATVWDSVITAAVNCVNDCKDRYTQKYPDRPQLRCEAEAGTDVLLCEYFCKAVDSIAFPQFFASLSQIEQQIPTLETIKTMGCPSQANWSETLKEALAVVKFLVLRAETLFEMEVKAGKPKLDTGTRFLFFWALYDRLAAPLANPFPTRKAPVEPSAVISELFAGKDITQFKIFLLQVWNAAELLRQDQIPQIASLNAIGNPITMDQAFPLGTLCHWFSCIRDLPEEYDGWGEA
jgi:hypothetical protein